MKLNKEKLAAMTATSEELVDKTEIAERFGVSKRTVERLIEANARILRKSRRRQGRKMMYPWSDVLKCARIHTGIEQESISSTAIKKAYTKQQVRMSKAEKQWYSDLWFVNELLVQ